MAYNERRGLWRVITLVGVVAAVGLFVLSARFQAAPSDPTLIDSAVQRLLPSDGSPSVLRQAEIGIDLEVGWTAVLNINGVRIPEDEMRQNGPANEFDFTPGEGKAIRELAPGDVVVTAIIWRPIDGQTENSGSRPVTWRFRVN